MYANEIQHYALSIYTMFNRKGCMFYVCGIYFVFFSRFFSMVILRPSLLLIAGAYTKHKLKQCKILINAQRVLNTIND